MIELETLLNAYGVKASAKSTLKDKAKTEGKDYLIFSLRNTKNGDKIPCSVYYKYNATTGDFTVKNGDSVKDNKTDNKGVAALELYAKYINGDKSLANVIVNDKINYNANAKAN